MVRCVSDLLPPVVLGCLCALCASVAIQPQKPLKKQGKQSETNRNKPRKCMKSVVHKPREAPGVRAVHRRFLIVTVIEAKPTSDVTYIREKQTRK
jgi:hypothetical protein